MLTISPRLCCRQFVGLVGALLLCAAPILYAYWQDRMEARRLDSATPNPPLTAQEATSLASAAAQFPYIPKGEQPDAFLVTNPGTVAAFGIARRGDAVLVYPQANIAVLYDRRTENIINVIPLAGSGL
jgi:hypothetical protein